MLTRISAMSGLEMATNVLSSSSNASSYLTAVRKDVPRPDKLYLSCQLASLHASYLRNLTDPFRGSRFVGPSRPSIGETIFHRDLGCDCQMGLKMVTTQLAS